MARLILAVALLSLLGACGGELRSWHTSHLGAEYSGRKADQVQSFEDYLALEQALFEELDEKIYRRSPTGPAHALERYSSGSVADPRGRRPDWNRSFELGRDNRRGGVLLLHGMSDSPYSLRALGETLAREGYRVLGLRLPGHGTIPAGLASVQWQDMADIVALAMAHLHRQLGAAPVHVIGYSNGAALAIDYALDAEEAAMPASLVLVSPAIGVSPAAALAGWKRWMSYVPGLRRLAWSGLEPEFDPYKYNSFATNAAEQVHLLTRSITQRIAQDAAAASRLPPTLVLKSAVDDTVSIDAVVERFLLYLAPRTHELVIFDINRFAPTTILMRDHPGPITRRLLEDTGLPFAVTLVGNAGSASREVVAARKAPFSGQPQRVEPLGLEWPPGVFSLSHVALPFPPDDPLYGRYPPADRDQLFLGYQAMQGERGVLRISPGFLLRLRHNPFYHYLQQRTLAWLAAAEQ